MVIICVLNAVLRKLPNLNPNAILEIQLYPPAGGYTLLGNGHVRLDMVNTHLRARVRIRIALFLVPFSQLVLWSAWPYFVVSFACGEVSLNPGGRMPGWRLSWK